MLSILIPVVALTLSTEIDACRTVILSYSEVSMAAEKEVPIISRELKFDANYNSWYNFTIKNNTKKTIVAFEIGIGSGNGNRFKHTIPPQGKYTVKFKIKEKSKHDESFMLMYGIQSVVFADGTSKRYELPEFWSPTK